ncbi:MAG: DNA-directed RNA polymerase [Candidatus Bathyarchaeia archaeon]
MFKLVTLEDVIRIPPEKFGKSIEEVAMEQIKMKYESFVDDELGYVILVVDVKIDPVGKILPGDGSTYHKSTFQLLVFYPQLQEVIEGEVVEVTDFGAFVRTGPEDALLHVSQIMDDFLSFDGKRGVLQGKETQRKIEKGDSVRARVIAVSFPKGGSGGKIGITMRQPFLGRLDWIEEDVAKSGIRAEAKGATGGA